MADNFAVQPHADTLEQRAKRALRTAQTAMIDGVGQVPLASSLSGAPLVFLDTQQQALSIQIDALMMTCELKALAGDEAEHAAARYVMRHGGPKHDGAYCVLHPIEARWGDGETAHEIEPSTLLTAGEGELAQYERRAVDHMNDDHLDAVKSYAEVLLGAQPGEWRLASLDMEGLDLVRCDAGGTDFRRLWFHPPLSAPGEIKSKLVQLAMAGRS